ncbi:putative aspartate aminotransferase [Sulfurospirillum diekertiae]|uniref:Aspartate aminotransferase n=1 Tax=Sulfurospirillum diekertiae TaxID=1854492 RepID=A0A290HDX0_9BACT|nr:aminotransferase class I/II-fold pyridoxal phosphate-dependent enzyme [Sulfurospirillum diekertiae]ATB69421.1 putative aspartate aminotransferase [Sulfurospirillum diekertiae]
MRCNEMSSFIVMDIVKEAEKFEDSIHFEIGQPDLPPSPKVKKALHVSIDENHFSYTQSHGLIALREKIANHYATTYGVSIDIDQIFLTPGTSGAFLIAYALTLKAGANLGLSDPSYPCYKNFAHLLDIKPQFMPIGKEDEFELHVKDLKPHQLNALQISSPANPTGNIYKKENLKALVEYCEKENIAFISDELYHGLTYEENAHSALEFSKNVLVINGFSKYYCMPGQRLGWVIVPKEKVRHAEIVAQNLFISAPTLSQYGALEAFDEAYLTEIKAEFKARRDFLYTELSTLFEIDAKPEGAFYIWANISKYSNDSFAFAKELLENIHVATTPGIDFGSNGTNRYLRFAYTRNIEHMREGIERLRDYLSKRR